MTNILTVDAATVTGWATQIDGVIESGVQDFSLKRGESPGMRFIRFGDWLRRMNEIGHGTADQSESLPGFAIISWEQAHHRGGYATNVGVGLSTRLEEFAARIGAETMQVHTSTLKKWATGRGNAGKPEMCAWFKCRTGRDALTDDEADALALMYYTKAELGV